MTTYPTTPQGWAALNWDQLCATPANPARWGNRGVSEAQVYLAELRRQIASASTNHILAVELAMSCPLQTPQGELVFQHDATVHSQTALAQALREQAGQPRDPAPLADAMRAQTRAVRAHTKTLRRSKRVEA